MSNKKIEAWKLQVANEKTIFVATNVKIIHPVVDRIVTNSNGDKKWIKIRFLLLFYRRQPLSGENNYSHPNNNDAAAYHGT